MTAGTENETHTWFCSYRAWSLCGTSNIFERTHTRSTEHWTPFFIFSFIPSFRWHFTVSIRRPPIQFEVHRTSVHSWYCCQLIDSFIQSGKMTCNNKGFWKVICFVILSSPAMLCAVSFHSIHFNKEKEENYESSVGSSWLNWLKMNNVVANELWIKLNE